MFVLTILEKIIKQFFYQGSVVVLSKMTNYQEATVKSTNTQLKKQNLKSK